MVQRPGAQQGLVDKHFLVSVGGCLATDLPRFAAIPPHPPSQVPFPFVRNLGENVNSCANVLSALGIMRRRGIEPVRRKLESVTNKMAKFTGRFRSGAGITSHVVER